MLGSLGTLLGAGCLSRSSAPGGTETTTATSTTTTPRETTASETPPATEQTTASRSTATTAGSADVTVTEATVTPQYVARNSPDSIGVSGDPDEQFVVLTVAADGADYPTAGTFALEAGRESYDPADDIGGMGGGLWGYEERYAESGRGWLAFAVPKPLDADAVTATWPGSEYALGEDLVAELARPPTTFELREFAGPDAVQVDEDATLSLTVANTGDADGTFVGALNRSGPSVAYIPETAVHLPVPAGETVTWEYTNAPDDRYGTVSEDSEMTFRLQWRNASESLDVTIESSET
jgi:hypothetical protein